MNFISSDFSIIADGLGKCYQIYEQPLDRLKQSFWRARKRFYQEFWALRDIRFEIKKGEAVGIIGSNGAGKTTLLQLICGTLSPTVGELHLNGRLAALLELGSGFNPNFTGQENVYLNAAIMGLTHTEIDSCYDSIVAFADIGQFIKQPVKTYSSGMYVRLAFAIAINISPDILVIDEALAVGDVRFQQKCIAKMKSFCKNKTVLFVSHDTSAIIELCSRVLWIEGGRARMDGSPKLVTEKYLEYMYEGDKPYKTYPQDMSNEPLDQDRYPETEVPDNFVQVPDDARQFGNKNANILKVAIRSDGGSIGTVYSGKPCEISLVFETHSDISHPIIGFLVKDRLGRGIIGDNTALMRQNLPFLPGGRLFKISFFIKQWPNVSGGSYILSLAIADGCLEDHQQCQWVHEIMVFESIHLRSPAGIFSVLDTNVEFTALKP